MPFVFDDETQSPGRLAPDREREPPRFVFDDEQEHRFVFDDEINQPKAGKKARTWYQAAGDTAVDAAKGVVGLGESVVGLTDLLTGNVSGKGWSELGFDPARTKQILSELYSEQRQQANQNVSDAKGFVDTTKALIDNPMTAAGAMAESAPMMLGSVAAVRTVAMKMLASRGLVAGSSEAAAFLANPAVVARLTAIGSAAEGAMTSGSIQEQGRQAGRDYADTAPSALAGGVLTGAIGVLSSKVPGFHDAEVGAALAGMSGSKRQGIITAGREIAKGMFKEGVLEEMPQSAQEQVFTNLATGKPWDQGVPEAAAQGMVVGAGQGGGMNTYASVRNGLASSPVQAPAAPDANAGADSRPAVTPGPGPTPAPVASRGPTAIPEVRLAELDLTAQTRELTPQELGEFDALSRAMDEQGPTLDAAQAHQSPAFEDVPDFLANADTAPDTGLAEAGDTTATPNLVSPTQPDTITSSALATPTQPDATARSNPFSPTQSDTTAVNPKITWFKFLNEKGVSPAAVKKGSPQWTNLKTEFSARNASANTTGRNAATASLQTNAPVQPPMSPALSTMQGAAPSVSAPDLDLQNRDRGRAASVMQMASIARKPDYGRLGTSRTPDSGAPMVFPVGDDGWRLPESALGKQDVAVMSDGQRVPFFYAVMDAREVEPSHFADGGVNPAFEFKVNGTVKALNNGRVAGIRASHEQGTSGAYVSELIKDAANHGIPASVIERTSNPILVRAYQDASNAPGMAARSQGQGLGMSRGELARQDAPMMDATVLTTYRPGDVGSAANRDFVRAFVGKLVQSGQDVAGMMGAQGTLSPAGRIRIQAALVQAAYGDADLVQEMFESQDSDIKAIGEAIKATAGQWADMRDSARMGAIDAQVDVTDNLVQAIHLIRKARQERTSLYDLVKQPDLMTGQTPSDLTIAMLRMFYGGPYLTTPFGRDKVTNKLYAYVQAAMSSAHGADMFGEQVTVAQILATITQGEPTNDTTKSQERSPGAAGVSDIGRAPDDRGAQGSGKHDGEGRARPGEDSPIQQQTGHSQVQAGSNQADQVPKAPAVEPKLAAKIEDAGQKIGGARKDRWKERGLNLDDLESMSESEGAELVTKANVWKPDYAAMVQAGTRPDTAAFIKVVFDSLAAKPKDNTPEGRRRYVDMMQQVRQTYSELAKLDALDTKTPRKGMTDAAEALKVRLGLRSQDPAAVKDGKALLFSVYKGRSDPFVVGFNEEQRARKLVADGFPDTGEPWKKRLTVRAFGGPGLTEKGVEIVVDEAATLGTPITPDQLKAGVYRVVTKAGQTLAYLSTQDDAQAAAKNIYEGKLKQGPAEKAEPARPHLDKLARENLPQRIDRDATAEDFVKDFGFRGIEFGNWAAQDERQRIINMAYDGLQDLAQIMGLPPKALSLNGSLGLAFGARGGGKFAAHYEPGKLVINMTKLQGGGSMAHEWAHGLDHYFGELNQKDAYTTKARGASGWYTEDQYKSIPRSRMEQVDGKWVKISKMRLENMRPEMAKAFDDVMSALFSGQETKAEMIRSLELQLERTQALANSEKDPQTKAMYQRMAESQGQNLQESRNEPDGKLYPKGRSQFAGQAQALSGKSANGYWTRPTEMFARAFESWAFDKVVAMGGKSDYLVHGVEETRFAGGQYKGNPYPTGQERATINAAFDQLAKTIKTKETDKGVAMFSRNSEGNGDLLTSHDRADALKKQAAEAQALKVEQKPAAKPAQKKVTADQVDMFNPQESLFARRASIAKSLPVNQVQSVVTAIRTKWGNAPDVVVVASMEDPSIPKAVRDYDLKQRSLGASGSPEGFIHGGKVYVVADQLATPSDVIRVLFHEALGHLGLRGVFGAALNPILKQIILARRPEVVAKAKAYGLDMSKPEDALTAAEEVLAAMAQDKPELAFVKRAVAAIRTWLRANVPGFKDLTLTDAEIIRSYILPARAFVQQGQTSLPGEGQAPAFSRNSLGDTPPQPLPPGQNNAWTVLKNRVMRLTSPQNIDKLIYEFQDKHIDLKRLRDHIKELGGTITDLNDAYLGEELFHKRLAKRTEDFLADELKPLLVQMRAAGVTTDEFETFLHARHAPEANAAMAKRNPNRAELDKVKTKATADVNALELQLQHARTKGTATKALEAALDEAKIESRKWFAAQAYKGTEDKRLSLSGMSDDEAAARMASLTPRKREDLNELAAMVDAINGKTLDLLEKYGLMDRASISAWRNAYEFYVPLHRDEAKAESSSHPVGMGFSVKGNAAKQRTGSNEKVTHILGHIAMQREAALTRGEKNHVAKKLYLMAAQNPDEDVWSVDKPPMTKTIDANTGIVRVGVDPLYKTRANVLMVRIAGKDVAIVFNEDNPQAMRLVGAMKNMDVGDLHVVLGLASKGTRWFASVNTQYNPIFGLVNFARDFSEGLVNLSTTALAGKQLDIAKGVPAAMRAVYRQERGKGAANVANQEWIKLWEEMQNTGGATGYRDMYANAEDRVTALTKELGALDRGEVSQAAHAVVDWLSHYNESMENAVRLSAYKVARDTGMTKERAASLSKNLTVNFNRKGRQTREIGALYAFFNAAIQGTTRMVETLKGPTGKRIMLGGVTLGVINGLVGMTMMGGGDGEDDEWDKIPEFIKENSLVIPLGRKDYLTIPMPLGFKVFPNIGRLAVEFALGGPDKTTGKQLGKLLSVLIDAFNPLGGTQNLGQMAAPTVIDPIVALMQNRDWTGRPIYRENNNPLDPQPGTKMVKNSASTVSKALAKVINAITGGTEYRPGAWSPSPDQFDYVFGQLTGGLGRELLKANQAVTAPFTGDELPPYKIPLIGRLYGNTSGPAAQSEQFYENVKTLNEIGNEIEGMLRHGGDVNAYLKSEPLSDLARMGSGYASRVSKLRKNRKAVVEEAAPGYQAQAKEIDAQIGEAMADLNRQVAKARRQEAAR